MPSLFFLSLFFPGFLISLLSSFRRFHRGVASLFGFNGGWGVLLSVALHRFIPFMSCLLAPSLFKLGLKGPPLVVCYFW
jgi:hypothetical protein